MTEDELWQKLENMWMNFASDLEKAAEFYTEAGKFKEAANLYAAAQEVYFVIHEARKPDFSYIEWPSS